MGESVDFEGNIDRLFEFFDLSIKLKDQYYRDRPIMRFLHLIGIDRGPNSRASQYAIKRAKEIMDNRYNQYKPSQ